MNKIIIGLLFITSLSQAGTIGKITAVKGRVFMMNAEKNKPKEPVKVGMDVCNGCALYTGDDSYVIYQLGNKIVQYLPEKTSKLIYFSGKMIKVDAFIENDLKSSVVKNNADVIKYYDEIGAAIQKSREAFERGDYVAALQSLEKEKIRNDYSEETAYIKAVSYLKLGLDDKAIPLFTWLINTGTWEYRDLSRFGLFLSYSRVGDKEKSNEQFLAMSEKSSFYGKMKKFIEDKR